MAAGLVLEGLAPLAEAKSYSSGGRSYSSHSSGSSRSFSSGGSRSSSSGGSRSSGFSSSGGKSYRSSSSSSGGGSSRSGSSFSTTSRSSGSGGSSKTFNAGGGKSYSSGSTWSDSGRKSYSSGKSYSSTASSPSSSKSRFTFDWPAPSSPSPARRPDVDQKSSGFAFDTAAAGAKKEEASKQDFTRFKESQTPAPKTPAAVPVAVDTPRPAPPPGPEPSHRATPPPLPSPRPGTYSFPVYIPDAGTMATRSIRIGTVFNPYRYRPVVIYRDPYNSLFWWWLLDRSLDDRAYWAYHHHYDMDPARYQALVESDQQLRARVEALETQQVARDTNYVPAGIDRDLMYSDRYVGHVYSNRPTMLGAVAFWVLGVPTAIALCAFFIWLVWFKRWQTAT